MPCSVPIRFLHVIYAHPSVSSDKSPDSCGGPTSASLPMLSRCSIDTSLNTNSYTALFYALSFSAILSFSFCAAFCGCRRCPALFLHSPPAVTPHLDSQTAAPQVEWLLIDSQNAGSLLSLHNYFELFLESCIVVSSVESFSTSGWIGLCESWKRHYILPEDILFNNDQKLDRIILRALCTLLIIPHILVTTFKLQTRI